MTANFRFFYELVQLLKEQGEPFITLDIDDPIPSNVGVIITSDEEARRIRFGKVVAGKQPVVAVSVAKSLLKGGENLQTIVIGIDPGSRPGVALIGDGRVLTADTVQSPEKVADIIDRLLRAFEYNRVVAKVGHGDKTNRNRIIRAIWNLVDDVEIVDETSTTRRTEEPDADAAVSIALSSGYRLPFPPEVSPTPGEIKDIQRLSRIESQGRVTISSTLAEAVARGELTLVEALAEQDKKSSR